MLNTWYQGLVPSAGRPMPACWSRAYWDQVMAVKAAVNKELENLQATKAVGGGLPAEVTLYADAALKQRSGQAGR